MWIVAIAWMYVTLMMALAEATNPQGTVLGAIFTFLLYGVGPLALVLYLMGAPARRKAILKAERAEREAMTQQQPADAPHSDGNGVQADGGGLTAAAPVAPVREEPPGR
jgi:hypothetical protein